MADKRDILINLLGRETVSPAAKKAADGVEKLGDRLDATADDAKQLDREIDQAEKGLRDLAVQFARTQDAAERLDLSKAMRKQQNEVRRLGRARDLLPGADMGADLAGQVSVSFAARLGPMLARAPMAGLNPAVLAVGAPIAAGLVTLVGTALGGAIIGGTAGLGIVGGLKLAARDAQVQREATALGEDLSAMLGRASSAFVPETLGAIDTVRRRVLGMEGDFRKVFTAAARYVDPLTDGLLDAAENAMPGLIDAVEAAGPIIDVVAEGMRDLGDAVGDGLSDLAPYADEAARAIDVLFFAMEGGVRAAFSLVEGMSKLYKVAELVGALMAGDIPRFFRLASGIDDASGASIDLSGGLGQVRDAASGAATKTQSLVDVLVTLNDMQLSANEAERGFQEAVDNARDAFDKKVKSINLGTERGREYGAALDRIAKTARDSAQAIYDQTGSVTAANAKIDEGRTALYKQARQYGLSEEAAWAYVDGVLSIPRQWNTRADFHPDNAGVKNWKKTLSGIDRHIFIKAEFDLINNADVAMALRLGRLSKGGPVTGAGPKGVDSQPYLLAPGEHVLTAAEVDAAGGHSGVEKLRAALRGESAGEPAVPAAVAGGRRSGPQTVVAAAPVFQLNATGASGLERVFMAWLAQAIRNAGGNPQVLGLGGNW